MKKLERDVKLNKEKIIIIIYLGYSIFMDSLNFSLSQVEHEKSIITSRPVYVGDAEHVLMLISGCDST